MVAFFRRMALSLSLLCLAPAALAQDDTGAEPTDTAASTSRDLHTVEESVHNLKERVFRSKATLQLLRELVIESATMGSGVSIWHVNDLPKAYVLESIQYFLDGRSVYAWSNPDGTKEVPQEVQIRDQTVSPGSHTVQVTMVLRGNGGMFGYVQQYEFKVQSSYAFEVEDGRLTTLRVRAVSQGGVRRAFVDRPTIVYEERAEALQTE
jgi:hypothetical protein